MVIGCARDGLVAAWRRPGLACLLWAWTLVLASTLAVPAWTWWHGGTATTPEADVLLDRFAFGLFTELVRNDTSLLLLAPLFVAVALAAFAGQALVAGGTIEVLTSEDARPLLHRFFRGAGHFFARFLRAGVYGALLFLMAAAILMAIFGPISRALGEVDWEPAWYLGGIARLLLLVLLALFTSLAIDYARIRMAAEDSRGALRALGGAVWFVATHPKATISLWLVVTLAAALVFAIYLTYCAVVPSNRCGLILLTLVVQQAAMLARAGLRAALVAGEIAIWTRVVPRSEIPGVEPFPNRGGTS